MRICQQSATLWDQKRVLNLLFQWKRKNLLKVRISVHIKLTCNTFFLILDCVNEKFGQGSYAANSREINRKANQKCLDIAAKRRKTSVNC